MNKPHLTNLTNHVHTHLSKERQCSSRLTIIVELAKGLPAKWWDRHGGRATVIEVLPHNQYLLCNAMTGNELVRSENTLAKIPQ